MDDSNDDFMKTSKPVEEIKEQTPKNTTQKNTGYKTVSLDMISDEEVNPDLIMQSMMRQGNLSG